MAKQIKLSPVQWFKVIRIIMDAFRAAGVEYREAREADSEGGSKVVLREARDIVLAALSSAVEQIAEILVED